MSSSTAPKVGDTITTYDQLKQLPDGTVLTFNRLDGASRFVQHDGDTANLLDKDGDLRNWASAAHPLGDVSYVVTSIPEADPEPEPEWRVGQTVDTYEELRKLPEGAVITLPGVVRRRRTIETRDGVLGAWDDKGCNMLPALPTAAGSAPWEYTITRLPAATEASDPADDLAAFKRQVVEVATRLAEKYDLCNEVDKALEELGLPIRNRKHTVTMTVTMQIDLGPDSDPSEWDNEHGRTIVEEALKNTGATVTDATATPTAERSK